MLINGTEGADTLTGTKDSDSIFAFGGADNINATQGADTVDGGAGNDRLTIMMGDLTRFDAFAGPRTYTLTATAVTDSAGLLNTTMTSIQRITFSSLGTGDYDDIINAGGFASAASFPLTITTGNGSDTITGSGAADSIIAGRGSNWVDAGAGEDTVRFNFDNSLGGTVVVTGTTGSIIASANGVTSTALNAEDVYIMGDDLTTGTTIDASAVTGNVRLAFINSMTGSDVFIGHNGVDVFGTNYLATVGGDTYTGNGGADILDYVVSVLAMNGDVVTDFDADDLIDLTFNNAAINGGGAIADHFIGAADFSGTIGEYRFRVSGATTLLEVDTNGDGLADQTLTLSNGTFALVETSLGSNQLQLADSNVGTSDNDTFFTTSSTETILGLAGNDFIIGNGGDDVIDGGTGNDWAVFYTADPAIGGVNVSLLLQGAAQDSGHGWVTLIGIEYLVGTAFSDILIGDSSDNVLSGGDASETNNDQVDGGAGNDLLNMSVGSHTLIGGSGIDTIRFAEGGAITLSLAEAGAQDTGKGTWTISGVENLAGGADGDTLIGDANANILAGDAGADQLFGGDGDDSLFGDGRIDVDPAAGLIFTAASGYGEGDDVLDGGLGNDVLDGGDGRDTASYASATGAIRATLNAGGGGGSTGAAGADSFVSIESIIGSDFNDVLTGNSSANDLDGSAGNDVLFGAGGNDRLTGGAGYDRMYGGAGDDTYIVNDSDDYAYELAGEGRDGVVASIDHQLRVEVEDLTLVGVASIGKGNASNNAIVGNDAGNKLYGYQGDDALSGGEGDDYLLGGDGNDSMSGGAGYDRMYGSIGDDTYIVGDLADYAYENIGEGYDTVLASLNHQLRANIERLVLDGSSDLRGYGNGLDNDLVGNGGANLLYGKDGNDTILGNAGNDILYGENGNDTLTGGTGQDRAYGGAGADLFTFDDPDFAGLSSGTADRIHDFSQLDGDRIALDQVDADTNLASDQGFAFIGTAAFSGAAGELRYQQIVGNTYVQGDTNGDGVADFWVRIDGLHALVAGDLLL